MAKRNLGIIIRFKQLKKWSTQYVRLYCLNLESSSVIPVIGDGLWQFEQVQKRFLKNLYFREFHLYDNSLSYTELVLVYKFETLKVLRNVALFLLLQDLLYAGLDAPSIVDLAERECKVVQHLIQILLLTSSWPA